MGRIAVTGSSGLIGRALLASLEAGGEETLRLRRGTASDPVAHWDPVTGWVRPGALDGCDAVVHLAGASIGDGRWSARRKAELVESRTAGTRALVEHMRSAGGRPPVLVTASAVGYYGDRGDEVLDEASTQGRGFLAELVAEWEREVFRAEEIGVRVVALRFGIVLSKEGGALQRMLLPFRFGAGGPLGSGKHWMSFVSVPDAVAAARFALATPGLSGVVNVTSPRPVTNRDFTKSLGRALRRPALFPVPPPALKLLFGRERAEELLLVSQRVMPGRLAAVGFRFEHESIDAALAAALG